MSVDSGTRRVLRGGTGAVVRPQAISDKTYVESVVSFLHDVVPQAVTGTPRQDDKESVVWVKFEEADYNDITLYREDINAGASLPLLLILGYTNGFQIWSVPSTGEAQEVVSLRQGPVRLVHMIKTPPPGSKIKDEFASARPLFAVCDAASPSLPFSTVNLWSLSTGEQVHSIGFKSEVFDVLCNRKLMVVALQEKIAAFDACTLKSCFCIMSCFPAPSPNLNPLALGTKWLAYADRTLVPSHQCCGGVSGDNSQSYTATVISAAKTLTKGLTMFGETVGRWTGADAVGDHGNQGTGKSLLVPGIVTIIDTLGIGSGEFCVQEDDHEGKGIVAHFPAHAGQPLSALEFDPSGSLLVTADVLGHNFHVFHIMPHPVCPSLGAVHHLYTLHRGETTATVHSITFTFDSRWVSVSTLRGTVHVFPITPYGGAITVRTHGSPRVVNRSSRFHTSAGLDDMERNTSSSSGTGRHSPGNLSQNSSGSPSDSPLTSGSGALFRDNLASSGTSNNGLANPRLPPLPHPLIICPFTQIRTPLGARCSGPCCSGTAQSSAKSNGRVSATEAVGAVAKFSQTRGWLGGGPTQARTEPARSPPMDSLFILELHGNLIEYVMEPHGMKTAPQSDDTPLELSATPRARWSLGRSCQWLEIKGPLSKEHAIVAASREVASNGLSTELSDGVTSEVDEQCFTQKPHHTPGLKQEPKSASDDRWLSNIEMETHAAPHRRLWMGPQFSFKTFQPPGSSLNGPSQCLSGEPKSCGSGSGATITPHGDGHPMDLYTEELDLQSLRLQPVRSDPVPTPSAKYGAPFTGCISPNHGGSVPLVVDNGPGSLPDVWPGLSNGMTEEKDDQLVETIAEAMNDNTTAPFKGGKKGTSSLQGEQFEFNSDSHAVGAVSAFTSCTPPEMHPLFPPNGSPDWS